jgi:hypothetical protein
MYILVPEASGEVKTNTYYAGGYVEWQERKNDSSAVSNMRLQATTELHTVVDNSSQRQ